MKKKRKNVFDNWKKIKKEKVENKDEQMMC